MYKKWVRGVLASIFISIIILAGSVIYIDPFFHYHKPLKNFEYPIDNQIYQNPGIAKNFDYESVLTGSSMTENFKTSDFDKLFNTNTIKVSYSGGRSRDFYSVLKIALENKKIKNIFWGLDPYALQIDAYKTQNIHPEYLYNEKLYDDIYYLLNKDVIFKNIMGVVEYTKKGEKTTSFDKYTYWNDQYKFGKDEVLKGYVEVDEKKADKDKNIFLKEAKDNLDINIIPLIEKNPDTNFYMFFPPYSILFWYDLYMNGELDAYLKLEEYIISKLIEYDNVKLYYFQNNSDIICNLDNYKDYTHYSADINDYMLKSIKNNKYLLTKENYKKELEMMREIILEFKYEDIIK